MRKSVLWGVMVVLGMVLAGCSSFTYPNGGKRFTVLTSGNTLKSSQRSATSKARSQCRSNGRTMKLIEMREIKNGFNRIPYNKRVGSYKVVNGKNTDFYTALEFTCEKQQR
jgi:hypothetical protein